MKKKYTFFYLMFIFLLGCSSNLKSDSNEAIDKTIPAIRFEYIASYPHDITAFTEGFLIHDGEFYESTGATEYLPQTRSMFGTVDLATGEIETKVELDKETYFGEGIAILNNKVYQLTYKSKQGFVYDLSTFEQLDEFVISSDEGWGMTTDGEWLIMSDGSYQLKYIDPQSMQVIKTINVTEQGTLKVHLNELEYIKGYIFANVWLTNTIVKIDPLDGKIVAKLDLADFASEAKSLYGGAQEMNGIAYDSIKNTTYITGKMWPKVYEVKLID